MTQSVFEKDYNHIHQAWENGYRSERDHYIKKLRDSAKAADLHHTSESEAWAVKFRKLADRIERNGPPGPVGLTKPDDH